MDEKVTTEVSDNIFLMHLPGILFLVVCFGLMTFSVMSMSTEKRDPVNVIHRPAHSYKYIKPSQFIPKPKSKKATFSAKDIAKGKAMISKGICVACHKVDIKLVGPSFKDIAKKYKPTEANIKNLVQKIIKGGKGSWGQIPMAPNPQVSEADGKLMVKYILSVK